ncbi:HigA family addiction module antitoxin [Methylobacterium aquaticum]|uniref:HigA family addiction module antitoxin n=1 Tax=Methylobacterium aquaticum TaxID=270351 RepID=UPI003D1806D6
MMHDPAHPGQLIRQRCLEPAGLSVTKAAEGLGVTRKSLSELLNGHNGVSPEMALRLELAGFSKAEVWLEAQIQRDLWEIRQRAGSLQVRPLVKAPVA